jgi:class 3 adenylate cyclase
MGDAIMATFSEPHVGLKAAMDMLDGVRRVHTRSGEPLGLKLGLHEGPALAINNEGTLDYFGQTVNIAARVQGLATAGEIWITDSIMDARDVPEILRRHPLQLSEHRVSLKGVGGLTRVFRCTQNTTS